MGRENVRVVAASSGERRFLAVHGFSLFSNSFNVRKPKEQCLGSFLASPPYLERWRPTARLLGISSVVVYECMYYVLIMLFLLLLGLCVFAVYGSPARGNPPPGSTGGRRAPPPPGICLVVMFVVVLLSLLFRAWLMLFAWFPH